MSGRLLVMSDIHGMYHDMVALLDAVGYDPRIDTLTVLGDYIDRGLHSREVMEYFMDLKSRHGSRMTLLKGNDEDLCLQAQTGDEIDRAIAMLTWKNNMADTTLESFQGAIPDDVIAFMEEMPFYAETEGCIFVHAGVDPMLPLSENDYMDCIWSRASSQRPHFSGKMVVVGHSVHDEVTSYPASNTLFIDTGACRGAMGGYGKLSLVDLTNRKIHWVNTGNLKSGRYRVAELAIGQVF